MKGPFQGLRKKKKCRHLLCEEERKTNARTKRKKERKKERKNERKVELAEALRRRLHISALAKNV